LRKRFDNHVHGLLIWNTLFGVDAFELELIQSAQGGSVEAFSSLVERYWTRLVRIARSIVGDSEAEDCVQDALVVVWEKLSSLRDSSAFPAWTTRIVTRRCMRRARHRMRFVALDVASDGADPAGASGRESIHVQQLLGLLPARQRAVMHLTVIEGMSDSEIGEALSIAPASVRSHRRRARDVLREVLQEVGLFGGKES
jgi:RNA polymerase sigma-70 factor (ECF subfamily)